MALVTHQRSFARTIGNIAKQGHVRSVLLVGAEQSERSRAAAALTKDRWSVREVSGGAEALGELERELPETLVIGSWLPDLRSDEFRQLVCELYPHLDAVSYEGETLNRGVRSERRQELMLALRDGIEAVRPPSDATLRSVPTVSVAASKASTHPSQPGLLIGLSAPMQELRDQIHLVASFPTTVLIEGETGTGKELVAKSLHECSSRVHQPFVVLNCAAIPEALLEAELFGHTRGAFTGAVQSRLGRVEAADGGTLFLDEIGEMPLPLQAKMLRFLENGELQRVGDNALCHVDVRVIAATHRHLEQRCEEGLFRLDLFHRLAVFPIEVPPLRDRLGDIVPLTEHFLDKFAARSFRKQLTPDALEELLTHSWPGNVRELMHVVERAVILSAQRSEIRREDVRIRRRPR